MANLGNVFISMMLTVAWVKVSSEKYPPPKWLYGEDISTGDRFYLHSGHRTSRVKDYSATYNASVKNANYDVQCTPTTECVLPTAPEKQAWVFVIDGKTQKQTEYWVNVNTDSRSHCFELPKQYDNSPELADKTNELNALCEDSDFRVIKGAPAVVEGGKYIPEFTLKDGEYTCHEAGSPGGQRVSMELHVREGLIEHIDTTSLGKPIEQLYYTTVGEAIYVGLFLERVRYNTHWIILEPTEREVVLQYEKMNRRNLESWFQDSQGGNGLTEALPTREKGKSKSRSTGIKHLTKSMRK
ncbi:hypothetical protein Pmar_PMAR000140, partial [Perkinsus marinus ATCC 50983]